MGDLQKVLRKQIFDLSPNLPKFFKSLQAFGTVLQIRQAFVLRPETRPRNRSNLELI